MFGIENICIIFDVFAALVEQVWDPLSAKQTRRLVTTIQGLICDYPSVSADSKQVQVCLNVQPTIPGLRCVHTKGASILKRKRKRRRFRYVALFPICGLCYSDD